MIVVHIHKTEGQAAFKSILVLAAAVPKKGKLAHLQIKLLPRKISGRFTRVPDLIKILDTGRLLLRLDRRIILDRMLEVFGVSCKMPRLLGKYWWRVHRIMTKIVRARVSFALPK